MSFVYRTAPSEAHVLAQGDLLRRSDDLVRVLKRYYPYFADNPENQFFQVITQSCDLVPRRGGACKARYIELASVRPLAVAIEKDILSRAAADFVLPFPVCSSRARDKFAEFLRRLFNNNDPDYFFLPKHSAAGLPEHYCAFLHLTIPLKVEHYDVCVSARILSLETVFQAKLGWIVGQLYSRVGTPDWSPADLNREVSEIVRSASVWIHEKQMSFALEAVRTWQAANPGKALSSAELYKLVEGIPNAKSRAAERLRELIGNSSLVSRLRGERAINDKDVERLVNHIQSDSQYTALFERT